MRGDRESPAWLPPGPARNTATYQRWIHSWFSPERNDLTIGKTSQNGQPRFSPPESWVAELRLVNVAQTLDVRVLASVGGLEAMLHGAHRSKLSRDSQRRLSAIEKAEQLHHAARKMVAP